jgi:hypothetical protein
LSGADHPEPLVNKGFYGYQPDKSDHIFHIIEGVSPYGKEKGNGQN